MNGTLGRLKTERKPLRPKLGVRIRNWNNVKCASTSAQGETAECYIGVGRGIEQQATKFSSTQPAGCKTHRGAEPGHYIMGSIQPDRGQGRRFPIAKWGLAVEMGDVDRPKPASAFW